MIRSRGEFIISLACQFGVCGVTWDLSGFGFPWAWVGWFQSVVALQRGLGCVCFYIYLGVVDAAKGGRGQGRGDVRVGCEIGAGRRVLLCLHGESLQAAVYRAPELGLGNFWAPMPGLHVRSVTV